MNYFEQSWQFHFLVKNSPIDSTHFLFCSCFSDSQNTISFPQDMHYSMNY